VLIEGGFEGLAVSVDGKIVQVNQAFASLGHCTREQALGMSPLDFATKESRPVVFENIKAGSESPYEITALRVDGSTFPCEVRGRNVLFQGKPARITAVRDITERAKVDAERKLFEERMQESQKLENLGMLAGGVAHDFNNLLAVVLGHAGIALKKLPADSPSRKDLSHIHTAALRASELTKQMLTYAGKGKTYMVSVDLAEVVQDIAELLRVTVSSSALLTLDLQPKAMPIEADAAQLRQVIMNLITNASEALGGDGGEIRVQTGSVTVREEDLHDSYLDAMPGSGECVFLAVSDTGRGMSPEVVRRIFDPFFTTKFTGRGLGLASVLGVVKAHRAAIRVKSEPGRGSTFTLYFPVSEVTAVPRAAPPVQSGPFVTKGVAIVADDEAMLRKLLAEILSSIGFSVVHASDGFEAVQLFRERAAEVKVVLLDVTMPRMNGREALDRIRRMSATVPVVVLSGYADDESSPASKDGATVFMAKPFESEELVSVVRALLGRAH
jgi:two-component system cell cycle sensor histidine kinase/response regulator CckA